MRRAIIIALISLAAVLVPSQAHALTPCEQAAVNMQYVTPAEIRCVPRSEASNWFSTAMAGAVAGWFFPDVVYVINDYDYDMARAIIMHEAGHRYDWAVLGNKQRYGSADYGWDVEEYARVFSWVTNGMVVLPNTPPPAYLPTSAELANWQATGFMPGYYDKQIRRLYLAAFGREPDNAGMQYWIYKKANGWTLWDIAEFFARSSEFTTMYGPNLGNGTFAARIYVNVLGRQPDFNGLSWWTSQLNCCKTRGWLLVGFSESAEFKTKVG